jgi:hypothetical protein
MSVNMLAYLPQNPSMETSRRWNLAVLLLTEQKYPRGEEHASEEG